MPALGYEKFVVKFIEPIISRHMISGLFRALKIALPGTRPILEKFFFFINMWLCQLNITNST